MNSGGSLAFREHNIHLGMLFTERATDKVIRKIACRWVTPESSKILIWVDRHEARILIGNQLFFASSESRRKRGSFRIEEPHQGVDLNDTEARVGRRAYSLQFGYPA